MLLKMHPHLNCICKKQKIYFLQTHFLIWICFMLFFRFLKQFIIHSNSVELNSNMPYLWPKILILQFYKWNSSRRKRLSVPGYDWFYDLGDCCAESTSNLQQCSLDFWVMFFLKIFCDQSAWIQVREKMGEKAFQEALWNAGSLSVSFLGNEVANELRVRDVLRVQDLSVQQKNGKCGHLAISHKLQGFVWESQSNPHKIKEWGWGENY